MIDHHIELNVFVYSLCLNSMTQFLFNVQYQNEVANDFDRPHSNKFESR